MSISDDARAGAVADLRPGSAASPAPPAEPVGAPHSADQSAAPGLGARVREIATRYGMVWILIALAIVSDILYPGFFNPGNLNNMIAGVAPVAIVAVGMTFVIIAGGFDLSVGAVFAVASVTYAGLGNHVPLGLAFLLTCLVGMLAGVVNGVVITRLNINPFIATLASSSLFSGFGFLISNSNPIVNSSSSFTTLGTGKLAGIWDSTYVLVGFLIVAGIVLARTTYGRSIYAVGGNGEAARLAGMRTSLLRMSTFMITGLCAAVAGMIVASQTGVGQADIGSTITLDAIAIVIVGGTSLMGGEGAMWRTVVGILIWGTITNLFSSLALSTSAQLLLQGAILLVAVALDSLARGARR